MARCRYCPKPISNLSVTGICAECAEEKAIPVAKGAAQKVAVKVVGVPKGAAPKVAVKDNGVAKGADQIAEVKEGAAKVADQVAEAKDDGVAKGADQVTCPNCKEMVASALLDPPKKDDLGYTGLCPKCAAPPKGTVNWYPGRIETDKSTVSQPQGNNQCSIYSPCAAYELVFRVAPAVAAVIKECGVRIGGNAMKPFKALMGKNGTGLASDDSHKGNWLKIISTATTEQVPVCLGIGWGKNYANNHWIYMVGWDKYVVYGRDQQNGHRLIRIAFKDWKGEVYNRKGVFRCMVKQLGLGCQDRDTWQKFAWW
jgi:hypothetical protein